MNGHNFRFTRIINTKWAPICIVWGVSTLQGKAPNEVGLDIAGCVTNGAKHSEQPDVKVKLTD